MNHRLTVLSAVVACTVLSAGLDARAGQFNQPSSDLPVQPAKQTATQLQQLVADGYRFRAVASGRPTARVVPSGHTISNVRFVAYPVQYRLSGVMTFIVTVTGVVYQRDLGPETSHLATTMINRVPTSGWVRIPQ